MLILDVVLLIVGALVGFAGARVRRSRRRRGRELGGLRNLAPAQQASRPMPAPPMPPAPQRPAPPQPVQQPQFTSLTAARLEREAPPGPAITLQRRAFTIGRRPDRDLVLTDDRVSREHATVLPVGGGWGLRDDGSSNGTWLNGHRIATRAEVPLRDGDRIDIGGARFLFRQTAPSAPAPDATRLLPRGPR